MPHPLLPRFGALLLGLLGTAAPSSAAVVYYNAGNVSTPSGGGYDEGGIWFDFVTGSVAVKASGSGYLPGKVGQYQLNLNSGAGYLNLLGQPTATTSASWSNNALNGVDRVGNGQSVDAADAYNTFTIMASAEPYVNEWDGFGRGYIGVRFTDEAANVYYGYADVTVNGDYTATLHAFAYETTPGTGIVTGAIPEPSIFALLGAGALLVCRRRRLAV